MNSIDDFYFFWYGKLSQWYECKFEDESIIYNCTEQYMMYQKAVLFEDREMQIEILKAERPRIQKNLGRYIRNFDPVTWDKEKFSIVVKGNYLKFSQNSSLKEFILGIDAEKEFVEASPYDKVWGIGLSFNDERAWDKKTWQGENLLGEALMQVRLMLLEEL